jgi:sorbitol-specific phosphotransferase system component IIC
MEMTMMEAGVLTVLAAMVTILVPLLVVLLIAISLLPVLVVGKCQADKEGTSVGCRVADWL